MINLQEVMKQKHDNIFFIESSGSISLAVAIRPMCSLVVRRARYLNNDTPQFRCLDPLSL